MKQVLLAVLIALASFANTKGIVHNSQQAVAQAEKDFIVSFLVELKTPVQSAVQCSEVCTTDVYTAASRFSNLLQSAIHINENQVSVLDAKLLFKTAKVFGETVNQISHCVEQCERLELQAVANIEFVDFETIRHNMNLFASAVADNSFILMNSWLWTLLRTECVSHFGDNSLACSVVAVQDSDAQQDNMLGRAQLNPDESADMIHDIYQTDIATNGFHAGKEMQFFMKGLAGHKPKMSL